MDQSIAERKNKQNLSKLNSIIDDYEAKLDARVNQVIADMINFTKKVTDPPLLPIVSPKRPQFQHHRATQSRQKTKSISHNSDISFLYDSSMETEMAQLRGTFKQLQSSKLIYESGRPVGNQAVAKPRFSKRRPDILPKEIRLNPFSEKNAIKAYELDKGLLSLIEKGKIGKDVNIITAFQKGRPVLQTQKAIFHQGEQRFAELDGQKLDLLQSKQKMIKNKTQKHKGGNQYRDRIYEENWAITMPKEEEGSRQMIPSKEGKQSVDYVFKEQMYLKIVQYEVFKDKNYTHFINKHLDFKGEIIQVLKQLIRIMKMYAIDIGYADSSKILNYTTRTNRLSPRELIHCLAGDPSKQNLRAIKNVRSEAQKRILAFDRIVSCLKFNMQRRQFLKFLTKKKIANRIYGWAVSCWTVKKHKEQIKAKKKQTEELYSSLQQQFAERYPRIENEKHYQIHVINESIRGKEAYKELMNIQITRIFNLKSVNKYIIYLLPYSLDEETINYYYKIMELEEIPNYKDRVTFLEVDPNHQFDNHLSISAKLYYNSKMLRKLKKKIKDTPAYFVVSYPSQVDIKLSAFLRIPIIGGNILQTLKIEKRSEIGVYRLNNLERHVVESNSGHSNLTALSDDLINYCQSVKRTNKFIVKINGKYRSGGLALLTYPFSSLPEMYTNTTLINQGCTVDEFYHQLIREGGIVEQYDENLTVVGVAISISQEGEVKPIGSFEKISSGFVNVGFIFPQKKIDSKWVFEKAKRVGAKLHEMGHYGGAEITFYIDETQEIYLQKVQCYLSHLGSSLYYYKFLSEGELTDSGDYLAKIVDTFDREGTEEEVVTMEPRCFCYVPFLLHFGLSDRQVNSFFQLCRMGGVSFDLQNKYGATFILLGSLKSSMGLITTAKDKRGTVKLMLKSLQFILKQNSHNMSAQTLAQKEVRMKERENILNIKERLEDM